MSGPFQIAPTNVFSPTQIPGCTIWFDAADSNTVIRSGSTVTSWTSKGSATLTASSVGGGNILYSNYNNNPALYFNGTNTKMTTGTVSSYGTTGTTWLTVSANLTPISSTTPVDSSVVIATLAGSSPEKSIRYQYLNQFTIYAINNGFLRGVIDDNTNGIRGFIDQAATFVSYVNGSLVKNDTNAATYQAGTNQSFQLGQWNTGYLLGYIQEVLVYNSALSLSQYQLAEGYLAWKWGLQGLLPSNHPYKNTPIVSSFPFPSRIPPTIQSVPLVRSLTNDLPFNPLSISGCQLWLDAADRNSLTLVGSNVTQWRDKSGNGLNLSQSSGSLQPVYNTTFFNNLPSIRFTAVAATSYQELTTATTNVFNSLTNLNCFIVFHLLSASTPKYPSPFSIQNKVSFYLTGATNSMVLTGSNVWTYNGASFRTNQNTIVTFNQSQQGFLSLASGSQQYFINGSIGGQQNASFSFGTGSGLVLRIGYSGYNTDDGFNGYISEVIFYTQALSTSQRQQVEGYLAWKWGLTASLPNGHPYKTPPLAPFPYAVRSASQVVFSPLSIPGCSLWLDAKDRGTFTLSGLSITQWADKSGNGRNAVGNTGTGTYSTNGLNSLPTVQITSTGNMRSPVAAGTFPTGILLYVVYQKTGANNSFDTIVTRTTNNIADPIDIWTNNTDTSRIIGRGPGNYWQGYEQSTNVARRTTPTIICMSAFSTTSNIWTESLNGTLSTYTLNNNIIGAPSYGDNATQIYIGTRADGATLMNGNISEIIAYSASSMNTSQRQQVEGYLAWKWGLQANLPANHPYKLFPPK